MLTASAVAPGTVNASPDPISTACGTPLAPAEIQSVIALSDTATLVGSDLDRFYAEVERNQQITEILTRHRDWRGLFAVGLDAIEWAVVVPLQNNPGSFADPRFGHAINTEVLRRFLTNLHNQFLGRPTDAQWTRYFDLAHQCGGSMTRVAMAGYNAHVDVDIPHSLAAVHAGLADEPDYSKVIVGDAGQTQLIVDRTRAAYGVEFEPLWQLVIAGSPALGTVAFVDGLALQNHLLAAATEAAIAAVWQATDVALMLLEPPAANGRR